MNIAREAGAWKIPTPPVQIQGFKCPRKTLMTTEQKIRKALGIHKQKKTLFQILDCFYNYIHSFHATSPSFYHVEVIGEKDKVPPAGHPLLGKQKESSVCAPTHCSPLNCLCSPPGVTAARTVNHIFHSVLSLPISQQGHILPSFSPITKLNTSKFQEIQLRVIALTLETHSPSR